MIFNGNIGSEIILIIMCKSFNNQFNLSIVF